MHTLGNYGGGGDVLPCRVGLGSELHMWRWGSASPIGQGRVLCINSPSMFLIGAMSVYPCQFCSVSSVLQNQSHESPPSGAFLELWRQEKKKAHCCCSFSDGKQAICSCFTRQTDITVARDVAPSWAGVDVLASKDTAHQAWLKKELKEVMARAHSQLWKPRNCEVEWLGLT